MIEYSPFWHTLKTSNETTYTLIHKHHVSSATIDKLRKNKPFTTIAINKFLNCRIEDVAVYIPSNQDQYL